MIRELLVAFLVLVAAPFCMGLLPALAMPGEEPAWKRLEKAEKKREKAKERDKKRENADKRDHYDTELPVTFRRLRGKRWE